MEGLALERKPGLGGLRGELDGGGEPDPLQGRDEHIRHVQLKQNNYEQALVCLSTK